MPRTKQTKPRHIVENDRLHEDLAAFSPDKLSLIFAMDSGAQNKDGLEVASQFAFSTKVLSNSDNEDTNSASESDLKTIQDFGEGSDALQNKFLLEKKYQQQSDDDDVAFMHSSTGSKSSSATSLIEHSSLNQNVVNQTIGANADTFSNHLNKNQEQLVSVPSQMPKLPSEKMLSGENQPLEINNQLCEEENIIKLFTNNSPLSPNTRLEHFYNQYSEHFRSNPLQHQAYRIAASTYLKTLKCMMQKNALSRSDFNNSKMKNMWTNVANTSFSQATDLSYNSQLYQIYLSQLAERWNSVMISQSSKPEWASHLPYYSNQPKLEEILKTVQTNEDMFSPEQKIDHNGEQNCDNLDLTETKAEQCILSSTLPSKQKFLNQDLTLKDQQDRCPPYQNSFNNDHHNDKKSQNQKRDITVAKSNNLSLCHKVLSPINVMEEENGLSNSSTSLPSGSSTSYSESGHLRNSFKQFTSHGDSSSSWANDHLSKVVNKSDIFSLSHTPTEKNIPQQLILMDKEKMHTINPITKGYQEEIQTVSPSNKTKVKSDSFLGIPDPSVNSLSTKDNFSRINLPPQRKFSVPSECFRNSNVHGKSMLEEMRRHCSVSNPPLGIQWLGGPLSPIHIASPTFCCLQSPLTPNSNMSGFFFPPSMTNNSVSDFSGEAQRPLPQPGAIYSSNISCNIDPINPVQSSSRKLNGTRRSRTRCTPIDNVHAAIVREAKEQFKGLDPENMYIQCPICQKKIKRLYHFQRHMRIHTGEKTHQCPCCQYKSVRKDNLKSHMKTHEKQTRESSRKTSQADLHAHTTLDAETKNRFKEDELSTNVNLSLFQANQPKRPLRPELLNNIKHSLLVKQNYNLSPTSLEKDEFIRKNCVNSPFSGTYSMSSDTSAVTSDSTTSFDKKHEKRYKLKSSTDFADLASTALVGQKTFNNLKYKLENENSENEHLNKLEDLASREPLLSRPISYNNPDLVTKQSKREKRVYKPDNLRDLLSYQDYKESSKRRKVSSNKDRSFDISSDKSQNNCCKDTEDAANKRLYLTSLHISAHDKQQEETNLSHSSMSIFPENNLTFKIQSNKSISRKFSDEILDSNSRNHISPKSTELVQPAPLILSSDNNSNELAIISSDRESMKAENINSKTTGIRSPTDFSPSMDFEKNTKAFEKDATEFSSLDSDMLPSKIDHSAFSPKSHLENRPKQKIDVKTARTEENRMFDKCIAAVKKEPSSPIHQALYDTEKQYANIADAERNNDGSAELNQRFSSSSENEKLAKDLNPAPAKSFICRLCSSSSTSAVELQAHMVTMHKKDGLYKCDDCNYLGKNLSKLIEHIRTHTGERPFKCDQCSYAAKRKDNLAQHKAVRHDKRKTKSNSLFPINEQTAHESSLVAGEKRRASFFNPLSTNQSEEAKRKVSVSFPERYTFFPNLQFSPNMDIKTSAMYGSKDKASTIPTFCALPAMPNFPQAMFRYPLYSPHSTLYSTELQTAIAGHPVKGVTDGLKNPGAYSIVHAALISQ